MLTLAAQSADIVSINWNVRAGVVTAEAVSSGSDSPTDERIAWVRAAARDRFAALELHVQCYLLKITDRPLDAIASWCSALGAEIDPTTVTGSPYILAGSVQQIIEKLLAMRERWNISYVSFLDSQLAAAAEIVQRLRGQ